MDRGCCFDGMVGSLYAIRVGMMQSLTLSMACDDAQHPVSNLLDDNHELVCVNLYHDDDYDDDECSTIADARVNDVELIARLWVVEVGYDRCNRH